MGVERERLVTGLLSSNWILNGEKKEERKRKEGKEKWLHHANLLNTGLNLQITFLLIWDLNQRWFERHLANESQAEMNHIF